jgi:uncharacterized protein (TIRG00374 family)
MISVAVILSVFVLLWIFSFKKELILNKIKGTRLMNFKTVISFIETLSSFTKGFSLISNMRSFFLVSFLTILSWSILFLVTYCTLKSLDFQTTLIEIAVILLLTSMAMSVPAAPGAIGTHHFATYYVMNNLLGFNSIDSQTFAIVLHAVSYLPLVAIGAYYFFKSSIHIFDVFEQELSN